MKPITPIISFVAGLALASTTALPAPTENCIPVMMQLQEEGRDSVVTLNRDGSWMIGNWEDVEYMSKHSSSSRLMVCIATELLRHKDQIVVNNSPDRSCGADVWEVIKIDPIMRLCNGIDGGA